MVKKQNIVGMKILDFEKLVSEKSADIKREIFVRPARLIPPTNRNDEMSLTSVFLASLTLVKEFRELFFRQVNISRVGSIKVYTEFTIKNFEDEKEDIRIDGLILVVSAGVIKDAAILEMKSGKNLLEAGQIEKYMRAAKFYNITKLISVSNQYVSTPTQYPIKVKLPSRNFELYHFSWTHLLTIASILLYDNETNIADYDQASIMKEVVTYFEHPKSGVTGFNRMSKEWAETVSKSRDGKKLSANDNCIEVAVRNWLEEERDMALILSKKIGLFVHNGLPKFKNDLQGRIDADIKKILNDGELQSVFKINRAVSNLVLTASFDKRRISMEVQLNIPTDRSTTKQMRWLQAQLEKCRRRNKEKFEELEKTLLVEYNIKRERGNFCDAYSNLDSNINELKSKELNSFKIIFYKDLGKDFTAAEKFIKILEETLPDFYKVVVQHLSKWEKPAPQIKDEKEQSTEE